MPEPTTSDALAQLRGARKRARTRHIDWVDAMYRAYVLTIVAVIAVLVASGYVGDAEVTDTALADFRTYGPAVIGVVLALGISVGLRSGSRGGPLALEAADVRHVLLAPVDRGAALRGAAYRQLRHTALAALAVGATAGQLAARRLPGNPVGWTIAGAVVTGAGAVAAAGAGYLGAGRRWRPLVANAIAFVLVAWSAADLWAGTATSPTSLIGRLVRWPLDVDLLALVGVAGAVAVGAIGLVSIAGLSIEAAERRSALIGRLAFAATLQDLRTVLVLRRQLAQEHARRHPWARRVPLARRFPVWGRGWRGVLRWPLVRVIRVGLLGIASGVASVGIARGTTPLVVLAGLLLYVAALDAVEPLAQEVDHPSRTESYPIERGAVHIRHLPVAAVVVATVSLLGLAVACALRPELSTLEVGLATVLTATGGAVAGAAIGTIAGPPDQLSSWALGAPEIAGVHNVVRLLWPPGLAVLGFVPVVVATRLSATRPDGSVAGTTATTASLILLFELGVVAWVHARDDVLANIRKSFDSFGKAP